jgi:cysteine desulfuration protein SufE
MTTLDDIVEAFELLGDWEQRYQYLSDLGEKLPAFPEEARTEDNKVKGCMSQVWVRAYRDPAHSDNIFYHADCDTTTIKGVIALLVDLMSDKTVEEIQAVDLDEIFDRLNLYDHLSPARHVGVYSIVEMMKQQARELDGAEAVQKVG